MLQTFREAHRVVRASINLLVAVRVVFWMCPGSGQIGCSLACGIRTLLPVYRHRNHFLKYGSIKIKRIKMQFKNAEKIPSLGF
ncbi:MAG: hypothetical protein AAF729_05205, partial [Pseudomonadota bacterium]